MPATPVPRMTIFFMLRSDPYVVSYNRIMFMKSSVLGIADHVLLTNANANVFELCEVSGDDSNHSVCSQLHPPSIYTIPFLTLLINKYRAISSRDNC
jgi:hypothetical protein